MTPFEFFSAREESGDEIMSICPLKMSAIFYSSPRPTHYLVALYIDDSPRTWGLGLKAMLSAVG